MTDPVAVIGIGADGWSGLSAEARSIITNAEVLLGSPRQLELVVDCAARRVAWPTPLLAALPGLLDEYRDARICVLASGDPMFHGIGATLAGLLGPDRLRVLPQPSSASLACARLGWPLHETPVISLVARPVQTVLPGICAGRRALILSADGTTPRRVADLLTHNGFGRSNITVLEQLGGPAEAVLRGSAEAWPHPDGDPLNIVAVEFVAEPHTLRLTRIPGLPDAAFGGTGQFTKAEVRAVTLSALAPTPGELLWDVGAGSGSIAIEWCRTDPTCRAVAFEQHPERAARISDTARALGVPDLAVRGPAPASFDGMPSPQAIFIGGGVARDGMLEACWDRLAHDGRLVVNAVTLEGEARVAQWAAHHPGLLRRIGVSHAESLGAMTIWRPKLPITQWVGAK